MKRNVEKISAGIVWIAMFAVWTLLVLTVDVRPAGQSGTAVGFATINVWFHEATGVHMILYKITDWLSLIPVCICMGFGLFGLFQLIRRKRLSLVDHDILFLGVYYAAVVCGYLIFEWLPINYRPILIAGYPEVSYPSSTTLLVLSVMPTLVFQAKRRLSGARLRMAVNVLSWIYSLFMVIGRLVSGAHWATDIVGAVLLSGVLFCLYRAAVLRKDVRNGIL